MWNCCGWASFLGGLGAWGMDAFSQAVAFWVAWGFFCGLLNMVTFDGDVGIVFVEAYNYLSELDILVRIIFRI